MKEEWALFGGGVFATVIILGIVMLGCWDEVQMVRFLGQLF